jgi:beta-lysine 5,6-aminomutase alpha subunit
MRAALDEVSEKERRYSDLTNYASGLCMPEIAAMGALERLDMMLNDSMYGILFRDINMYRTFVDQKFSRMLDSWAGIIINTGEDNYLTTSDAFEKAYTVLASQFLNERFAYAAGLPARLMGLGHAFEMDPSIKNGFLYELAQAQMAREIFPEHPLKYMPPTKFMSGDIFKGHSMDTMFNFVPKPRSRDTLLGMLTEANTLPSDGPVPGRGQRPVRHEQHRLIYDEIEFKEGGVIGHAPPRFWTGPFLLREIEGAGLFEAIARGDFADVKRPKGRRQRLGGHREEGAGLLNPFEEHCPEPWAGKLGGKMNIVKPYGDSWTTARCKFLSPSRFRMGPRGGSRPADGAQVGIKDCDVVHSFSRGRLFVLCCLRENRILR